MSPPIRDVDIIVVKETLAFETNEHTIQNAVAIDIENILDLQSLSTLKPSEVVLYRKGPKKYLF